jgi:hypothetical protein
MAIDVSIAIASPANPLFSDPRATMGLLPDRWVQRGHPVLEPVSRARRRRRTRMDGPFVLSQLLPWVRRSGGG